MTYFVFIDSAITSVPHMEPLDADCPVSATLEALACLRMHTHGAAAHIYDGDTLVASLRRMDVRSPLKKPVGFSKPAPAQVTWLADHAVRLASPAESSQRQSPDG